MDWDWINTSLSNILMVVVTGIGIYLSLILFTRLTGLRSFTKMSSFDFAITVAFGSIIASTILTKQPSLFTGIIGLGVLYGIQFIVSKLRFLTSISGSVVDNHPILLMAGNKILYDNLKKARVTEDDLKSKLRIAGITHPDQVYAVVMETAGDMAVIRMSQDVDPSLFEGVRGGELLHGL